MTKTLLLQLPALCLGLILRDLALGTLASDILLTYPELEDLQVITS